MSQCKLLQVNVTSNWGSTGRIAEGIGQAAIKRGWDSTIAFGRNSTPSKSQTIKVGSKKDVYLHYARHRLFDGEGLGSKSPTLSLLNGIRSLNPDIIHLHNIHDHWLNYPLLFEYLQTVDTPVVWTFHDCWAFTGGCAYFESPYCEKWKIGCENCPLRVGKVDKSILHYKLKEKLFKALGSRLTIVPVSGWLENYVCSSFLSSANIQLIHNGVNTDIFNISTPKNSKPIILGVALVWSDRKGLKDIIELRNIIPQDKADIVLVGLSEKQISQLPNGIKGITKTQNLNELRDLYSQSSLLINPTYADNFPTVNIEALACGTPVITYRTGGSPEAVDSRTGLVVEKGDVQGLARAAGRIIDNSNLFRPEDCRNRVLTYFNKDIQFDKYVDLYQSLI